jgi:tetratricopeptide (TPR) repeat protein
MLKSLLLCACAFILVFTATLLLFSSSSHAQASSGITIVAAPTPTPDANAVLNSANDAVSRAQDILNVVIAFTAILGVLLTLLTVFAAALTVLGVRSYREVVSRTQELRNHIASLRAEGDKTRQALLYLTFGDRLLNQKNVTEALAIYQKSGSFLPNNSQLQYILGRIYSGAGDYRAAITALEASNKALEVSPSQENAEVRKEKAQVLKELGLAFRRRATALNQDEDYQQAQHYLEQSLSYNRQDSDALAILGGLYRRKKAYKQAYESYKEAYDIDSHSSYALGNVASLSWYLGKVDDARKYFDETEREARKRLEKGEMETFWNRYDFALAQLASGKIDEAKQTYGLAISETPGATQFEGVLDNLKLLKLAPQYMNGLDEVIKMVEDALNKSQRH